MTTACYIGVLVSVIVAFALGYRRGLEKGETWRYLRGGRR